MAALKLDHVSKQFGGLKAVDDVCINIEEGGLHGLIGPNGAGKTTVFNLITGIYKPTSGEIWLGDRRIDGQSPHMIAEYGCTRTFQNLRLFAKESILDNVRIAGALRTTTYNYFDAIFKTPKYRREEKALREWSMEILENLGLADRADTLASNLPYGLQRRMEIARAIATKPKVLLLDEPAAGMNPEETLSLMETISAVRKKFGLTILLIEHHMDMVMEICEHLTVLNFGATIAAGTPEEIQANPVVVEAYLGKEGEDEA